MSRNSEVVSVEVIKSFDFNLKYNWLKIVEGFPGWDICKRKLIVTGIKKKNWFIKQRDKTKVLGNPSDGNNVRVIGPRKYAYFFPLRNQGKENLCND